MNPVIDFSEIQQSIPANPNAENWEPPRHVFYGKRDQQTGRMESEPRYQYQPYPQMLFAKVGEKIRAVVVQNADEAQKKRAEGYEDSPAAFGVVTAPTFDEVHSKPRTLTVKK